MLGSTWFIRRSTCATMVFVMAISGASGLFAEDPSTEIPAAVSAAFKKADRNEDQSLSQEEFVPGRGAADVAKRDFKLYDFDENGSLSLDEFASVRTAPAFDQPGAVPDYLTKAADSSVAAIDKAFGNWDQNPEQRVDTDLFLSRFIQDMPAVCALQDHALSWAGRGGSAFSSAGGFSGVAVAAVFADGFGMRGGPSVGTQCGVVR